MSTPSKNKSAPTSASVGDAKRHKKWTPRAPRSAGERLPKLYHGLTDQVDGGHFENAIKTCRKILALDSKSVPAYQTLLFLHLQTDDYPTALTLLQNPPDASLTLQFETAYCLYRLHREKEALEILEKQANPGRKEEHLRAQISYRLGDYDKAQDLYDGLLAGINSSSSEHPDILTNLEATTAHTDFLRNGYRQYLTSAPAAASTSSAYIPAEGELESYVPSLPTGWATGGIRTIKPLGSSTAAPAEEKEKQRTKPRHKLPKGAVLGKSFNEDPERWLPLRQRASYMAAATKRKGIKESMGTGFTQGSTTAQASSGGAGGGGNQGGGKSKKGKKK